MSLGKLIRRQREKAGLTLDEVSHRSDYSKPYLSTVETEKVKNPPADELLTKLEKILGFEPGILLHIAHMEKLPADLKVKFETIEAQNTQMRAMINELVSSGSEAAITLLNSSFTTLNEQLKQSNEKPQSMTSGKLAPVINTVTSGYPVNYERSGTPPEAAVDYVRCPDIHDEAAFAIRVIGESMTPKYFEGDLVIFTAQKEATSGNDCFVRLINPAETVFTRIYFDQDDQVRLQPRNNKYPPRLLARDKISDVSPAFARYEVFNKRI